MLFTSQARETFFKYPYLETIIIISLYLFIGYLLNPEDICMLEHKLSSLTILLAIITLFHGISSGLLAIVIIGIAMKVGYTQFYYQDFLKELVLVLIFGEFYYYWSRSISKYEMKAKFSKQKLEELSKAFYTLKISHDQIEESYVLKPMSVRNSIETIKNYFSEGYDEKSYNNFLLLLQKNFNIERACLCKVDNKNKITVVAQTNSEDRFDKDDLLIKHVFEKQMPVYISGDEKYNNSKYLAAIPIISNYTITGILVIEKMPFLSFNKDNLITAQILSTYLFNEFNKSKTIKQIGDYFKDFENVFRFEMYRFNLLSQKYDISSAVLVFETTDKLQMHLLTENIERSLRSLEVLGKVSTEEKDVVVILFPFSSKSATLGFVKRIYSLMDYADDRTIRHSTFNILQTELIESYIGIEN